MDRPVGSLRSPYESDNEWNLRCKFLQSNVNQLPFDRLVCLSMCYINHVSYGVTYSPGVMLQLSQMSEGLPSHLDIVKEKNSIAFVKPEEEKKKKPKKAADVRYENFIKSIQKPGSNNVSITKPAPGKYSNFVSSADASFQKTFYPRQGLGFNATGSADKSQLNSPAPVDPKPSNPATKYSGFVKAGAAGSENSKPCFSSPTQTFKDMLNVPNNGQSGSNISQTEKPKPLPDYNKYTNMVKPSPNSYIGSQANLQANKYRSKPVLMAPQEMPKPDSATSSTKKTLLTTPSEVAGNSQGSFQELDSIEVTYLEKKFYALSENLKGTKAAFSMNAIQVLNMALSKMKLYIRTEMTPYTSKIRKIFKSRVFIAEVQVGEGFGEKKKIAKHEAFKRAVNELSKSTLKVQEENGRKVLVGNDQPRPHLSKMTLKCSSPTPGSSSTTASKKKPISSWGHFLLLENKSVNNPVALIRQSADINRMPVQYVCSADPQGFSCQLFINCEPIMESAAKHKGAAKVAVAEKAIEWLKERCWTIVVKQNADSDNIDVSRDEIMGEIEKQFKPIPSDNVGNQLLRKMGWEGGGIGAEGNKGIADPIVVSQVIDRRGLGSRSTSGMSTKFETHIRNVLLNYVKSKNQDDLVFTSEFSKEERATIHKEARRYNLKSTSRGNGEYRHMIISRKRSAGQLFNHILASGGSTHKYELIPPLNKNL